MRKTAVLAGLVTAAVVGIGAVVYAQPYGPGWMGGGYGPGMMRGPGWGGYDGPGWMHGWMRAGYGPGWMHGGYGRVSGLDFNLTADEVKGYIEQTIRNPRAEGRRGQADRRQQHYGRYRYQGQGWPGAALRHQPAHRPVASAIRLSTA